MGAFGQGSTDAWWRLATGGGQLTMNFLPESLNGERVLGSRQSAELLNLSINTFRRLQWAGKLPPAIRIGERKLGWRVSDLRAWLTSRQVAA